MRGRGLRLGGLGSRSSEILWCGSRSRGSAWLEPCDDLDWCGLVLERFVVFFRTSPNASNTTMLGQLDSARTLLNLIDKHGGWNEHLHQRFRDQMQILE